MFNDLPEEEKRALIEKLEQQKVDSLNQAGSLVLCNIRVWCIKVVENQCRCLVTENVPDIILSVHVLLDYLLFALLGCQIYAYNKIF